MTFNMCFNCVLILVFFRPPPKKKDHMGQLRHLEIGIDPTGETGITLVLVVCVFVFVCVRVHARVCLQTICCHDDESRDATATINNKQTCVVIDLRLQHDFYF